MQHLEMIAIMALVPMGAWVAMGEGMILGWIPKLLNRGYRITKPKRPTLDEYHAMTSEEQDKAFADRGIVIRIPDWMKKPLIACPRCMVSVWGIPAVYALGYAPEGWLLPVYLLAACGLQELLQR
jgi:hypothetical protein